MERNNSWCKVIGTSYIRTTKQQLMVKVSLKGMKFYAFHGFYEFERRIGNDFILDVETQINMDGNPNDHIENTINYESIYQICSHIMQKKYKLLESVAYDIGMKIKEEYPIVQSVEVTLAKLNPPVGGKVEKSEIIVKL